MDSDAKYVETSAKTVDEAVREALSQLGVQREDVTTSVLDEGSRGFFGVGARPARVRVELKGSSPARGGSRGGRGRRAAETEEAPAEERAPEAREAQPARDDATDNAARGERPRRGGRGRGGERSDRGGDRPERGGRGRGASRDRQAAPAQRRDELPPRLSEEHFLPRAAGAGAPDAEPEARRDSGGGRGRGRPQGRDQRPAQDRSEERPPRERRERERPPRRPREENIAPNIDADEVNFACETIDDLLRILDIDAEITIRDPETPGEGLGSALAVVDLDGPNMGLLIGRGGETLTALQYLVNLIVSKRYPGSAAPIHLDVAHYRKRRELELIDLAQRMAARVSDSGRAIRLEPMSAAERRIIHLTLADDPGVETMSTGTGESRKVEIRPAGE